MHKIALKILAAACLSAFTAHATDFVTIGDVGNHGFDNDRGSISYKYDISKYEIDNDTYCAFLNNVASKSDPHGLYSPLMEEHFFGGIKRLETADGYKYVVKDGYSNRPVGGVTWLSAARFCNWLHYNSANLETGKEYAQFTPQTEGTSTLGAYDTSVTPEKHNSGAKYWLPTKEEWLKAGFFDGKKWQTEAIADGANIYNPVKGWAYAYPHIKRCGEGVKASHYGTFDQQGNVAEWVEDGDNGKKLAFGGSLIRPSSYARFGEREGDYADKSIISFGMRIARIADAAQRKAASQQPSIADHAEATATPTEPFVLIGDAGNPGDAVNQYKGRVNYDFYISRTELSNAEYCEFLNAVASSADVYGLYDSNMSTAVLGGINRVKLSDGSYRYSTKAGFERLPVVYVDYFDIVRYCNWLHYGKPKGKQKVGTTEGTSTTGAYDTSAYADVVAGKRQPDASFGKRNSGARFWIPSENEWYKAAYYDPTKLGNHPYHDYPTRTSDAPSQAQANYMVDSHLAIPDRYLAPVDSFANAPSYYGTLQQGGNVWEFTEDWQYGNVGTRALRGGSFSYTEYGLNALNEDPAGLTECSHLFGARIAKAATEAGYQPVTDSLPDNLTKSVKLLSTKQLLAIFCLMLILSTIGLIFILTRFYSFICSHISRKSKSATPSTADCDKSAAPTDKR